MSLDSNVILTSEIISKPNPLPCRGMLDRAKTQQRRHKRKITEVIKKVKGSMRLRGRPVRQMEIAINGGMWF